MSLGLSRRFTKGVLWREAIQSDVFSMILLFLSRGNNVDKMLLRTIDVGRARISGLKNIYKLANNVERGGNAVITLSRVADVFPVVTLKLLSTAGANIPRAVSLLATDFGADFPRQMQTVIAAAIFPKGPKGVQLMKALLLYLIEENKLLSNVGAATDSEILQKGSNGQGSLILERENGSDVDSYIEERLSRMSEERDRKSSGSVESHEDVHHVVQLGKKMGSREEKKQLQKERFVDSEIEECEPLEPTIA